MKWARKVGGNIKGRGTLVGKDVLELGWRDLVPALLLDLHADHRETRERAEELLLHVLEDLNHLIAGKLLDPRAVLAAVAVEVTVGSVPQSPHASRATD